MFWICSANKGPRSLQHWHQALELAAALHGLMHTQHHCCDPAFTSKYQTHITSINIHKQPQSSDMN